MRKFRALAFSAFLTLGGCAGGIGETHHIATVDQTSGEVVNVFRLTVSGGVGISNARYLAGYYDERAVDLFFNEVKATALDDVSMKSGAPKFWNWSCAGSESAEACEATKAKNLAAVPLGGGVEDKGAFVLLLSTNPDAIAGTIGGFAENENTIQAAMHLATRGVREDAAKVAAEKPFLQARRDGAINELSTLFAAAETASTAADLEATYLAILRSTAAGLQPTAPPAFSTFDEAKAWFAAQPRGAAR